MARSILAFGSAPHRAYWRLSVGEIDYAPPGVEHWHGAAPNEPLVQLGVVPFGGGITFLEPVTDAQYNGQAR